MKNLKLKIIFTLAFFFLFSPQSFASTCGVTSTGGNWNAAATWFDCAGGIPLTGDSVIATSTSGNLVINASTVALKSFDLTGYAGTLSGTSQLAVQGLSATTQNVIFDGTITWTGILSLQPSSSSSLLNLTTNGRLLNRVINTAGSVSTITLQDDLSFQNIKTASLTLGTNSTFNMNGFNISGYATTSRMLIAGSGAVRTLTRSGGTFAFADFQNINLDTPTDLSAIVGLSGDALGNTNITFTTATTTYWIGNSGNFDTVAEWAWNNGGTAGTSRVPLPQDYCVFDANSFSGTGFTVTVNQERTCDGVNFSAVGTDNPTLSFASTGGFGWSTFGDFILHSGMGIANISGATIYFSGSGNIDLQGATIPRPTQSFGNYTLLNDYTTSSTFAVNAGTFDANGFNVSSTVFSMANTASAIINMGSGTWTVTSTGSSWNIATNAVVNAQTSTIRMLNVTATAKNFIGATHTYYNLDISGDNVIIYNNNTFNNIAFNTGSFPTGTTFVASTVSTVAGISTNATTTSGRAIIKTGATGTFTLSSPSGNRCVDYMQISSSTASGGAGWYAGANSLDVTNNTGWSFTRCPATGGRQTRTLLQRFQMILRGKMIIF